MESGGACGGSMHNDRGALGLPAPAPPGGPPPATAENVMRSAPLTVRPHLTLEHAAQRLDAGRTDHALVTDADGRLIGFLLRSDVERRLADLRADAVSS